MIYLHTGRVGKTTFILVNTFRDWQIAAMVGERVVYATGALAPDADLWRGNELALLADVAMAAMRDGDVMLFQKRVSNVAFDYIAIKRARAARAVSTPADLREALWR